MLYEAKIAALFGDLSYVRRECQALLQAAHPSLRERLRLVLTYCDELEQRLSQREALLKAFRALPQPAISLWPQVSARIHEVAQQVQALRTKQLPALQATTPDDPFVSNLMEALCQELSLVDIHPVASLCQDEWVATIASPPSYPLIFFPRSVANDPGELPLMFHELGHVLMRLWAPDLPQAIITVLTEAVDRKRQEVASMTDPNVRADHEEALREWQAQLLARAEELLCDVVGSLLGGRAFLGAFAIGMLTARANVFEGEPRYPPLDFRVRLGLLTLEHLNASGSLSVAVQAGWAELRTIHQGLKPRFYGWLYDDELLGKGIEAVEAFLQAKGVRIYGQDVAELRGQLDEGIRLRLEQPTHYPLGLTPR
jgi:hypothetical protein